MLSIVTTLLPVLGSVLDKVIPNPAEREKARLELQLRLAENETELLKLLAQADTNQAEINKEEAKSSSLFVAGWRPFVGWVCGVGVAWAFLLKPIADWILPVAARFVPQLAGITTPVLDSGQLMSLLLGLLGMGGFRMLEKKWGVASK